MFIDIKNSNVITTRFLHAHAKTFATNVLYSYKHNIHKECVINGFFD